VRDTLFEGTGRSPSVHDVRFVGGPLGTLWSPDSRASRTRHRAHPGRRGPVRLDDLFKLSTGRGTTSCSRARKSLVFRERWTRSNARNREATPGEAYTAGRHVGVRGPRALSQGTEVYTIVNPSPNRAVGLPRGGLLQATLLRADSEREAGSAGRGLPRARGGRFGLPGKGWPLPLDGTAGGRAEELLATPRGP